MSLLGLYEMPDFTAQTIGIENASKFNAAGWVLPSGCVILYVQIHTAVAVCVSELITQWGPFFIFFLHFLKGCGTYGTAYKKMTFMHENLKLQKVQRLYPISV